jgi:hypothetical protein
MNFIDITDLSDSTLDYILEIAADDPGHAAELARSYADDFAEPDFRNQATDGPPPTPTHDGIDSEGLAIDF